MGAQLRQLRRRIKTVQSTKKITRAMELMSASRIGRAQAAAEAAKPYAERVTDVIRNVAAAAGSDVSHPLLTQRDVNRYGVLVLTSDRGLAGAYSSNVLRIAERELRTRRAATEAQFAYVVGRKGLTYLRYRRYNVARNFLGFSGAPTFESARTVADAVMTAYAEGEIDRLDMVFTEFISLGTQRPRLVQVLPVPVGEVQVGEERTGPQAAYEFEPGPGEILGRLLPSYVEARIYTALLEAAASEHAARRRAMKSATDNAEDLIKVLTRVANQARQAEITTEISEIVGGAEALAEARTARE